MVYFSVLFLCIAGLFAALLSDRYRFWTTVIVTGGSYLLALAAALILQSDEPSSLFMQQLPCIAGVFLFFVSSIFTYTNSTGQKLFLALISLCSYAFLDSLLPNFLGLMPFSVAGAPAGIISVLAILLFYLFIGLCLYRPLHHFSDRGTSLFILGMSVFVFALYFLCLGKFDFLFPGEAYVWRIIFAGIGYLVIIFIFRSLYQAGRFRDRQARETARENMMEMESGDFADMLAAVREVKAAQKAGEYALDTVNVMLRDGVTERIPSYIASAKRTAARNPILEKYHENPYLNAVIATKAAFAAQNDISFECNVFNGDTFLRTAELCILANEMLTRACTDATACAERRKVRFTLIPGEDTVRFEAVYSCVKKEKEKFTLQGKKLSDVLTWLFDESPDEENDMRGLDNTAEIVSRYSGGLSVSGTDDETILQVALHI